MNSASNFFLCLCFLLASSLSYLQLTDAYSYVLPIVKDNNVSQYFTSFTVGTPPKTRVYLVVSLENPWSWLTCDIYGYKTSSTYKAVPCEDSPRCAYIGSSFCYTCEGGPKPSCNNNTCFAEAYTPWGDFRYSGGVIEDVISLYTASLTKASLPSFPFTCADKMPLRGLSQYTKGILSLARYTYGLQEHIFSTFKAPRKFALCLPSSSSSIMSGYNGAMYFGGGPYHFPSTSPIDLSKSLVTTELVLNRNATAPFAQNHPDIEYFLNLRSIKVEGTPVRFNSSLFPFDAYGYGGTKISTMEPYGKLHNNIYKALIDVFVTKAAAMKIKRVASVAPFGACFSAKTIANTKTGPNVPIIDVIFEDKSPLLHNKNARWRFYGANSMVKVSNDVLCLAFVDGGEGGISGLPRTPVVIGAKQMEDTLVEIDLENSKVGITSSLLRLGTSCSQFKGI